MHDHTVLTRSFSLSIVLFSSIALLTSACETASEGISSQPKDKQNPLDSDLPTDVHVDSDSGTPGTVPPSDTDTKDSGSVSPNDSNSDDLNQGQETDTGHIDMESESDDDRNTEGESSDSEENTNTGGDTDTKIDLPDQAAGFLHVEGNKLMDDNGNEARLTGINWFGFETSNQSPHGLWARDYRSMLRQIADLGFNTVRIPWANAILRKGAAARSINDYGADPYDGTDPLNADLVGKTPLEIMDIIIDAAAEFRLKVMLDNHSREPDGYMEEDLWYTNETSESLWISDWVALAERYNGDTTVVAFDLNNEPHDSASWGTGNAATDWNRAAEKCGNAILAVNPNVLIVVEGVETTGEDTYWWGGNLTGVRTAPINLIVPEKLVYSAHEYGPEVFQQDWFASANFPGNMAGIWNEHFGFIMEEQIGHVFIGEFGLKDPDAYEGRAGVWFDAFLKYLRNGYSWTFWCFNPNSGDTEGMLQHDWLTPHQWKMDALSPYLAPFID
jgi:endoglucanase